METVVNIFMKDRGAEILNEERAPVGTNAVLIILEPLQEVLFTKTQLRWPPFFNPLEVFQPLVALLLWATWRTHRRLLPSIPSLRLDILLTMLHLRMLLRMAPLPDMVRLLPIMVVMVVTEAMGAMELLVTLLVRHVVIL